jgi:hypothetical protein
VKTNGDVVLNNAANLDNYEMMSLRKDFLALADFELTESIDDDGMMSYTAEYKKDAKNTLKSGMYLYEAMINGLNYSKSNSLMFIDLDTIKIADEDYQDELDRFMQPIPISSTVIKNKIVEELMYHTDNIMRKNA